VINRQPAPGSDFRGEDGTEAVDVGNIRGEDHGQTELYARDISGVTWRKSRYSEVDMNECVEVTDLADGAVAVRDSNNPNRPDLRFTALEWAAFVAGVRDGEF
jgi:hypothetical protein